jgi:hypothetical protein
LDFVNITPPSHWEALELFLGARNRSTNPWLRRSSAEMSGERPHRNGTLFKIVDEVPDGRALGVKGFTLDHVSWVCPVEDSSLPQILEHLDQMPRENPYSFIAECKNAGSPGACGKYPCAQSTIEWQFVQSALPARNRTRDTCTLYSDIFNLWHRSTYRPRKGATLGTGAEVKTWMRYLDRVSDCATMFTTSKGFIGLCSSAVCEGDTVALLHGASAPAVLRPRSSSKPETGKHDIGPSHLFRGFGFVPGVMKGQLNNLCGRPNLREKEFVLV